MACGCPGRDSGNGRNGDAHALCAAGSYSRQLLCRLIRNDPLPVHNDTVAGESACVDDCAANWPPFTASEPLSLPLGVEGELSLLERTDGSLQVAYNGIPLYYWARDEQAGDLTGQGVGDVWWIVAPGAQMGSAAALASPTSTDMGTPMAGGDVEVTLGDYYIHASVATFLVGEEYTFNATNVGAQTHELVFEPSGRAGRTAGARRRGSRDRRYRARSNALPWFRLY